MIYKIQNKRITNGPLEISYDILNGVTFTGIDINDGDNAYFAGSLQPSLPASDLLFYSEDFEIEDGKLTFNVNTYTENFLSGVTKIGTRIFVEIGTINDDKKSILLFDDAIAQPRVYVEGEPPAPTPGTTYATHAWVETNFEPIISNNRKLDYSLLSGAPNVNNSTITILQDGQEPQSFTLNQDMDKTIYIAAGGSGGGVTSGYVNEKIEEHNISEDAHLSLFNGKQNLITNTNKLAYSLLSGTPTIPTVNNATITLTQGGVTKGSFTLNQSNNATIEFDAGGGGGGGVTSSYVVEKISEHNLAIDAHSSLFNLKQDVITASSMLDASYLSGEIPSSMLPVRDVQFRDTGNDWYSCVTDGIAQLPIASTTRTGVVAVHFNMGFSMYGAYLKINKASNANITNRGSSTATGQPYENCPIVPNNLNFAISAAFTDANKVQWKTNELSGLQDAIGISNPGSGIITLTQGGAIKGSFNVNQSNNQTIALDAGSGGGGEMTYNQIYSSDTTLTAYHSLSYFWALQNQDATLYVENLQNLAYDIPIDINLSGSTVTLSGITRNGVFVDGFLNHCLITKKYDKTYLYVYAYDEGLPMETGWQGEWTTLGQDAQTFSAAAGIYEATGGGRYTIVGGAGYYIEIAGTNWRLFNASGDEVAMGPAMDQPMEGAYGTTQNPPGVGDSTLTVKLVNIIIPG